MNRRDALRARFDAVRAATEALAAPLAPEDQNLQAMPSASPVKWHRAHTTWFWETFLLGPAGVPPFDPAYARLFNSYYEALDAEGRRHPRPKRGLLSRPSADEVGAYRRHVDGAVRAWLERASDAALATAAPLVELGLAHEEQHQELVLTDLLAAFAENPLRPVYVPEDASGHDARTPEAAPVRFLEHAPGVVALGAPDDGAFAFDNERPRHRVFVEPFAIADRAVTVRELVAFVEAGAYRTPSLWLADGFDAVRAHGWTAPAYTTVEAGSARAFTLHGERELAPDAPAGHLSFYEADALARFLGARLPTEAEWEIAARSADPATGQFATPSRPRYTPAPPPVGANGDASPFGGVWTWCSSSYEAYPGFAPAAGAVGEYNGKFMVNQKVLRGGSCLTPARHVRATYRNFWSPETRFQMTGVRIARSVPG